MNKLTSEVFNMKECRPSDGIAVVNENGRLYFGTFKVAWNREGEDGWIGEERIDMSIVGWAKTETYLDASTFPYGCVIRRPIIQ